MILSFRLQKVSTRFITILSRYGTVIPNKVAVMAKSSRVHANFNLNSLQQRETTW